MQFTTYGFVLVVLPLTVLGYFLLGRWGKRPAQIFLILLSMALYACGGWEGMAVFAFSTAVNILLCLTMKKKPKWVRWCLWLGVTVQLGLLAAFKYLYFFAGIVSGVTGHTFSLPDWALPLGISFFAFQQISYLADTAAGKTKDNSLTDYLLYITYYPKLLMGPIVRQNQLLEQFRRDGSHRINSQNLVNGLRQFVFGMAKKVILAETFAGAAAFLKNGEATSMELILAALAYTFQIYFDFSGYTDMATGFSRMLNIELPRNFDSPYWAMSLRDFWKRWHMSLTRFFTDYIYIPLGGSRKGNVRMILNTMLVFTISGLWHGANWTFVLWGILNGALSLFDRLTEKKRERIHPAMQWGLTFSAVTLLWVLFYADSIGQFVHIVARMFSFADTSVSEAFLNCFVNPELHLLMTMSGFVTIMNLIRGLPMLLYYGLAFGICLGCENTSRRSSRMSLGGAAALALLLAFCLSCLSRTSVFVYNNF